MDYYNYGILLKKQVGEVIECISDDADRGKMNEAGRIIGYDNSLIWDLAFQGISTLVLLVLVILVVRLSILSIKALKIYI